MAKLCFTALAFPLRWFPSFLLLPYDGVTLKFSTLQTYGNRKNTENYVIFPSEMCFSPPVDFQSPWQYLCVVDQPIKEISCSLASTCATMFTS